MIKFCRQTHMGFKSCLNIPDKTFKLSFSFLNGKMGIIPTFQGYLKIKNMYLKCLAHTRQSIKDDYYYHHYNYLKIVGEYLKIGENLHGFWKITDIRGKLIMNIRH